MCGKRWPRLFFFPTTAEHRFVRTRFIPSLRFLPAPNTVHTGFGIRSGARHRSRLLPRAARAALPSARVAACYR